MFNANQKTIGIIGGVGPAATAYAHTRLIRLCQDNGAIQDSDFPRIVIINGGLDEIDETGFEEGHREAIFNRLLQTCKNLQAMGADIILPACNTIDVFNQSIQEKIRIPLVSLPNTTKKFVEKEPLVLCSRASFRCNVYSSQFVLPNHIQTLVDKVILATMGGDIKTTVETWGKVLNFASQTLSSENSLLIGCSELSMAHCFWSQNHNFPFSTVDSLETGLNHTLEYITL